MKETIKRLKRLFDKLMLFIAGSYEDTVQLSLSSDATLPTAKELAGFVIRASDERVPNAIRRNAQLAPTAATTNGFDQKNDLEYERATSTRDLRRAATAGGRVSVESQADIRFNTGVSEFIQLNTESNSTDIFNYSERYVRGLRPAKLLEMLSEASPEMSRALFDFLMLCCPGWEIKGVNENEEIDNASDAYLDECVNRLKENYKAPEFVFVKLFMSAFLRGAVCSELVLDARGREFVDIAPIDPDSLEHHRVRDSARGLVWKLYQRQGTQLVDLNIPQVAYIPIHPFFNSNRGRPLARPAVFVCFFLIATLQDLRRVIRQQGYPRVDIAVNIEKLKGMIPSAKANDLQALKDLAEGIVQEVKDIYKGLKPDDTFVHTEVVEVNQPVGTLNASSLGVVGDLLKALERMATRALKTMPLMMATTDGVSEANANRQWEIHAAGIKSMQHYAEAVLESHFNVALRAKGLQGRAVFRFAELRAAELLRDAQVEALNTQTARNQYDNGSISADEMAKKSADKDKADVPEPRLSKAPNPFVATNPTGTNPEPGGNRSMSEALLSELMRITAQDITNAETLFEKHAPAKAKLLLKAKQYEA